MPDFWKLVVPTVVTLVVGTLVYTLSNENVCLPPIALVQSRTKKSKENLNPSEEKRVKIVYATQTGSSKRLALILASLLPSKSQIMSIKEYETEDLFHEECVVIFILSTYTGGLGSADAEWFNNWLEDSRQDVRVGAEALSGLKYAVFGVGDSAYKDEFCQFGVKIDRLLFELGAKRLVKIGMGDLANDFRELNDFASRLSFNLTKNVDQVEKAELILSEDDDATENEEYEQDLLDIEDMGPSMIPKEVEVKEMVTPNLRKSLQKQRYHIVGTHSGVKICRWTKSMLRGRGGCYKHSFYGIASHQCMESTPSLACANKCVFCWRSHTNPVGTEWKWKIDEPNDIVEGAMNGHYSMIKTLKGVPGVKPERYAEAMQVRHCALSLVGEPIMYPRINELLNILHGKRISSFLVTNAQFPEEIKKLVPCTQLYVSIDAGTKEGLKKVDRPLFKDFWERYLACLDALKEKRQRTVYRFTLVKDFNTDEIPGYVDLVERGCPEFIEVKGVTYCGFTGSQPLTMQNVPYHIEVVKFCQDLVAKLSDAYELACVHEHSCSVLIANKKFKINDKWHTWIDYEKFHDLVASNLPFTSLDYVLETPDWAVFGSNEQGFDPEETKFKRNKPINISEDSLIMK